VAGWLILGSIDFTGNDALGGTFVGIWSSLGLFVLGLGVGALVVIAAVRCRPKAVAIVSAACFAILPSLAWSGGLAIGAANMFIQADRLGMSDWEVREAFLDSARLHGVSQDLVNSFFDALR